MTPPPIVAARPISVCEAARFDVSVVRGPCTRAMKVVFVNCFFHPDHFATSQMLSDLTFSLAGAGHDIHVVTPRQRYDAPDARLTPRETVDGVTVTRIWTTRFGCFNLAGRALDEVTSYDAEGACRRALAGAPAPTEGGGRRGPFPDGRNRQGLTAVTPLAG